LFKERRFFLPELEGLEVGEEILASFELDNIEPATLLFQTGYLTIKKTTKRRGRLGYELGFPNFEVKTAFSDFLISGYTDLTVEKLRYQDALYDSLLSANLAGLETAIRRLFAAIPWRNFTNNDLADFEGYYASVLYAFFSAIDCMVIPEDISNQGQADLTVGLGDTIYVLEIKLVPKAPKPTRIGTPIGADSANSALAQIIHRDYAAKYRGQPGQRVFELGLVFGRQERNLVQFNWREG